MYNNKKADVGNSFAEICNVCKKLSKKSDICDRCGGAIFTPIEVNTIALCRVIGHLMPDNNITENYLGGTMPNEIGFRCVRCYEKVTLNYKEWSD